jgi:hypothetical protein
MGHEKLDIRHAPDTSHHVDQKRLLAGAAVRLQCVFFAELLQELRGGSIVAVRLAREHGRLRRERERLEAELEHRTVRAVS